jgi:hypothetical protein
LMMKDFLGKYEDSLFSEVVFVEYRWLTRFSRFFVVVFF